jgi:hypothetical protein
VQSVVKTKKRILAYTTYCMKIAIINGPNLNLLGKRETDIYGSMPFDEYFKNLQKKYINIDISYFQSNVEGELINELQRILELFEGIDPKRILFTPNFAAKEEYEFALTLGCHLTIDSLYPLQHWPELFKKQNIFLRIDPGSGVGDRAFRVRGISC